MNSEHYEKQIKELEEENESHANELAKMDGSLKLLQAENNELKTLLNQAKIYKEREDSLILEIAELKNEISKCIIANGQLNENNQRLIEECQNRPQPEQGN